MQKTRKELSEVIRVARQTVNVSTVVKAYEPVLLGNPCYPTPAMIPLDASMVLGIEDLVVAHLRFDITPLDPMIALEKALKKSVARRLGALPVLCVL